jgi:hypothetical protein
MGMSRKGQASIEYLILFAVGLVAVSFVMAALSGLSGTVSAYGDKQRALLARESLLSAARDACYIGDGTSFMIELPSAANVTEDKINGAAYGSPCAIEQGQYSGKVIVKNEGKAITVKQV